ncbi:hypothetical protein ACFL5U_03695 [Candidatus Margulisiibacteriota bacterium]
MFTFRTQQKNDKLLINLDVFDLSAKKNTARKIVGRLDMVVVRPNQPSVYGEIYYPLRILWARFTGQARGELLRAGFAPEEICASGFTNLRLRSKERYAGFWIAEAYRQHSGSEFPGLRQVMLNTMARIAKGVGLDKIEIVVSDGLEEMEVGGVAARMDYYKRNFGAEAVPGSYGRVAIQV